MAGVIIMAFLKYGTLYFNKLIGLTKTELVILTYVNTNQFDTTLKLSEWAFLIGTTQRTISLAIKHLTSLNMILNKSKANKLILSSIDKDQKQLNEEEKALLNKFYKEIKSKRG